MDIIKVGGSLLLDTRARVLSGVRSGRNVKLGVSSCECLLALIDANGEPLSQNDLLDIGWRNKGFEVTSGSLRVAISHIRRAFISIQVDKEMTIVTVPKMGYRLVIYNNCESEIPNEKAGSDIRVASEPNLNTVETSFTSAPQNRLLKQLQQYVSLYQPLVYIGCLTGGMVLAWLVGLWGARTITPIHYVPYSGEGLHIPEGTQIFTDPRHPIKKEQVKQTLDLWMKYSQDELNHRFIYINFNNYTNYYGLFACKKQLGTTDNECSSNVFWTN